ncbi:MAG: hypothetical protein AAFQ14_07350 [Cyanobacteria bacterium J06621_12]
MSIISENVKLNHNLPSNQVDQQLILVSSVTPNKLPLSSTSPLIPVLMYGGVSVAVIIAMTYFSRIQLQSIAELLKTLKKKK